MISCYPSALVTIGLCDQAGNQQDDDDQGFISMPRQLQTSGFTITLVICLLVLSGLPVLRAQSVTTPDFSGLWFPRGFGRVTPNPLPYNEKAQKLYDEYIKTFTPDDDPGKFCIQPGLPRAIWGAPFPIEIHQSEREITIFYEGYFMYRKIYLEGYDRPEPVLPTRMGFSVGHWEGDTLVVNTTNLREYPYMIRTPNSSQATVVERMRLESRVTDGKPGKFLVDELTLNDPVLYTAPVVVKGEIAASPDTPILEYSCSETIWDDYLIEKGLMPPDFEELIN